MTPYDCRSMTTSPGHKCVGFMVLRPLAPALDAGAFA